MPWKGSKAVHEGNDSIPQDTSGLLGGITMEELRRIIPQAWDKVCDEYGLTKPGKPKEMRATDKRSADLEQDARQSRLATKADGSTGTRPRKRTEGAAAAERVMSGDNSSAQVDTDPIRLTSYGDDSTGPPILPCLRDRALVDRGAAVPKLCLSSVEMRITTAAGGLLFAGTAFRTMRTIFSRLFSSWAFGEETKKITSGTNSSQLALSYWRKVIQTKSRPTLVFDPDGCTGRLRSCPFLGGRRALRIG